MRLALPLTLLLGTLVACHPARITYDYDSRAEFPRYRTFEWAGASDGSLTDRRIRAAVEKELTAKGILRTPDAPPDLLVALQAGLRERQVRRAGVGVGIGLRILPGVSVGVGSGTGGARVETAGHILLEFRDTRNSQLVWKAEAANAYEPDARPEDSEADIQDAVSRMLAKFPPSPAR